MIASIRQKLKDLRTDNSGNATMLVALGLPVLLGGTGLAVDTAQWYMWKAELQFAVDQAALAGAWARTSSSTSVQDTYKTRASQEYNANLSIVADFDTFDPATQVKLVNYGGGATLNSVKVNASAAAPLPLSTFVTGKTTTVYANATAKFTAGASFEACMMAVNPHAYQAFKFGGSVSGGSTCGAGSLSDDPDAAMKEIGNTTTPLGKLIATGGIDEGFANNGTIYENQGGLTDPYSGLETPPQTYSAAKTYSCPTKSDAYDTADETVRTIITYKYYNKVGNSYKENTSYNGSYKQSTYDNNPGVTTYNKVVTSWSDYDTETTGAYEKKGNGQDTIYEVATTKKIYKYGNHKYVPANDGIARPEAGIYSTISIACPTIFSKGIYFVGNIDFGNNQSVTAKDVLFVMTSSSGNIKINSNTVADFQGITKQTLMDMYYYTSANADKIKTMLFWDKESTADFGMEGNASVKVDGIMYMPKRSTTFNGNVSAATGGCMMVASNTMTINGNFNISNFCKPTGADGGMQIGGGVATVKLVA